MIKEKIHETPPPRNLPLPMTREDIQERDENEMMNEDPWKLVDMREQNIPYLKRVDHNEFPQTDWSLIKSNFAKDKNLTKIIDGRW